MASRDPLRHNGSSVVMTFGRAPYLIAGGLLASVAVLWMAATGPLPHFAAPSAAAGTVDFTVAVNPRRKMILAADCSAEIKSCGNWAAIGVAAAPIRYTQKIRPSCSGVRPYGSAAKRNVT